jgi:GxxExxY protein
MEKNNLIYGDLSYKIIGIFYKIKRDVGLGHKESIYSNAFEVEPQKQDIKYEREKIIKINYDNRNIGIYKPDFIIDDKILIEIKFLPYITTDHKRQIWSYLKGSKYKLAILINFSLKDVEIVRIIYYKARGHLSPRQSAFSPRKSAYYENSKEENRAEN